MGSNSGKTNSGKALVYPLFLRDVGKYYWNLDTAKQDRKQSYNQLLDTSFVNNYSRILKFFDDHTLVFKAVKSKAVDKLESVLENKKVDLKYRNNYFLKLASWQNDLPMICFLWGYGLTECTEARQIAQQKGYTAIVDFFDSKQA
jgi:hypothetical protein